MTNHSAPPITPYKLRPKQLRKPPLYVHADPNRDVARIPLSSAPLAGHSEPPCLLVDLEDAALASPPDTGSPGPFRWNYSRWTGHPTRGVYLSHRGTTRYPIKTRVDFARVLLLPTRRQSVHHLNGDPLDCRRCNLEVYPRTTQRGYEGVLRDHSLPVAFDPKNPTDPRHRQFRWLAVASHYYDGPDPALSDAENLAALTQPPPLQPIPLVIGEFPTPELAADCCDQHHYDPRYAGSWSTLNGWEGTPSLDR
jgi:hypothetical protein